MRRRWLRLPGWSARPGWRSMGSSLLAGVAVAAGQAPWGLWWLALAGLAAVTLFVARADGVGRRAWIGWAAGVGYFAATLSWIVEPFLVTPEQDAWMAPFAVVFMAGGMALFWAAAGAIAGIGRGGREGAAGFALGLAVADLARSYLFGGFPWALVGHMWVGTPVAQAAAVVGPVGLTAITAAAVALPMAVRGAVLRPFAAAFAVAGIGALWAAGQARLDAPVPPRIPAITVRLIQPNATQALKWKDDMWRVFLDRLMEMTAAPAEAPLDLIVWPETAVPYLLDHSDGLFPELMDLSGGVPVAVGIQREEGLRFFNSMVVTDRAGNVTQIYDKYRLAPFGEYMPGGDLIAGLGITAFAAREGNGYTPGPGPRVLDLGPAGKVLPLICYEADFPQDLNAAPERADWILQITNDGWFGAFSGPYQHLAQMRLRAIEQGLPFLRSANTGISAVIDAKGRVLASLPLDTQGKIDAVVPPALAPTFYARHGDLPTTVALGTGVLLLILRRRTVRS